MAGSRIEVSIEGDTLRARAPTTPATYALARVVDDALLELVCGIVGAPRDAAIRTQRSGGEDPYADPYEPWREVTWTLPSGAALVLHGRGITSRHGVHGEDLRGAVSGLPWHVELAIEGSIDHRSTGNLRVTLRGADGLAALSARLAAAT